MGVLMLRALGYRSQNHALVIGLAYFTSLCLYTFFLVMELFVFQDKLQAVIVVSLLYFLISWSTLVFLLRKQFALWVKHNLERERRVFTLVFLSTLVFITGLFFLQIYHTAVLDEWLHRPIVKTFVENGSFPLVNPLAPDQDYIHAYHYGTQVIGAALALIFRLDVSASLDLFKLSVFLATFFLFYGLIREWVQNKYEALTGGVLVLFCGSSFFLFDSFTANHLMSFKGFDLSAGQRWPINAPLSYILTGITWVNIPMAVAFGLLLEALFWKKGRRFSWTTNIILAALLVGFFLISELFAVIVLLGFLSAVLYQWWREKPPLLSTFLTLGIFFSVVFVGVYLTGGIVGDMMDQIIERPQAVLNSITTPVQEIEPEEAPSTAVAKFLTTKPVSAWGFPSEKRVLVPWDIPFYYLRTLLLEVFILGLWGYLIAIKRVKILEHPLLVLFILIGLIGPFFFTTRFGDLNFAKTTTLSFVLLHLMAFSLLSRLQGRGKIWIGALFGLLLIFGSISGLLMGPNIQWQILSGKGRDQSCSQNPLCYKGEFTELLKRFEEGYPGLKKVATDPKSVGKVADLTNSLVYRYDDKRAEYIIETPELRKQLLIKDELPDVSSETLLESGGEYRIFKAKEE